jgi:hypothetical protein
MIWDGVKYCFNRVVGKEAPPDTDAMKTINTRYGGVFDYEFGKTIPFGLHRPCEDRTAGNLATSLDRYAHGAPNRDVTIRYVSESDLDGRVKRCIVFDAWFLNE